MATGGGVDPQSSCYFNENGENKEKKEDSGGGDGGAVLD